MATLKQKHNEVRNAFYEVETFLFGEDRVRAEQGFYNETIKRYQTLGRAIEGFPEDERDKFMRPCIRTGLYLSDSAGKVQGYLDDFRIKLNGTIWLREISSREKQLSLRLSGTDRISHGLLIGRSANLWEAFHKANQSLKLRIKGGMNKVKELADIVPSEIDNGFLQIYVDFQMAKFQAEDYLLELKDALKRNIIDDVI